MIIVLFAQIALLGVGLGFLLSTRKSITPRGAWWSFFIRDLLWLALTVDQAAQLNQSDFLPVSVTIVIQFVIVSLLFYSTIARYRLQRKIDRNRRDTAARVTHLETLMDGTTTLRHLERKMK